MGSLDGILTRLPRWQMAGLCLGLIAIIGAADDRTAAERLFALYYLVPVSLGAWYGGRSLGLALAAVATGTAFLADWRQVQAADLVGEIGIFVAVALLVGRLRDQRAFDSSLTLLTSKVPLRGPAGEITGVLGTFMDVSERKRAEESHARLSTAVEQSAEAIVITDAGGTIVYANPAFETASGHTRDEAMGRNPRMLKSGQHDAEFYRGMWAALSRGEVWRGRITDRKKDGTLFVQDATISPVRDAQGTIVNYVAVNRDVTKETLLEQQLLQAQKMEAVGRLAAGVAHDFNNLLGVITGYGELVYGRLADEDPLKEKVEQILTAGERAAGLTRQLLAFGRKQVLQPRILDLNDVVSSLQKMLPRVIGEDVEVVTFLASDLGSVKADPGQIDQILMNLAVNARDAMPDGGRITIETRNADLDQSYVAAHAPVRTGPYVMLAVTDTGSGMDAATQARIFEPSSRPRGWAKAPGSASPRCTGSSSRAMVTSGSTARPAWGPRSRSTSRA